MIENPDILRASSKFINGLSTSRDIEPKAKVVLKGPTDKQVIKLKVYLKQVILNTLFQSD